MSLHGAQAAEVLRDYTHPKMPSAVARSGMTDVTVAVVNDFHLSGAQRLRQTRANLLAPIRVERTS